jgi:hypothetical protein
MDIYRMPLRKPTPMELKNIANNSKDNHGTRPFQLSPFAIMPDTVSIIRCVKYIDNGASTADSPI